MKPNYSNYGLSCCMGEKLREEVERQLLLDLKEYDTNGENLKFDWSDSCIEGHCTNYLDGTVENFSGIELYNDNNEIVIDGWMEFIHEKSENLFIVYWDFLDFYCEGKEISIKDKPGIPNHILRKLPIHLQKVYSTQ